jgi:hypothetical protein
VTSGENPPTADSNDASSKLDEGLKACRAVINDYRAILTAASPLPASEDSGRDEDFGQIAEPSEKPEL